MSQNGSCSGGGLASFGSLVDLAAKHAGADGVLDAAEFKAFAKEAKLKSKDLSMIDGADGSAKDGRVSMGELVARMAVVDHADGVRGDNGLLSRKEVRGICDGAIANAPLRNGAVGEVDAPREAPGADALFDAIDGPDRRHAGGVTAGELLDFLVAAKDRDGRHLHGGDYRFNGDELKALAKATGLDEGALAGLAGSDGYLDIADLMQAVKGGDTDGSGLLSKDELSALLAPPAQGEPVEEPACGPEPEPVQTVFDRIDGPSPLHPGALTTGEVFDFLIQASGANGAPIHGGDYRFNGDEILALAGATGIAASAFVRMAGSDGILDVSDIAAATAKADTSGDGTLDRAEFDGLTKAG
jgi:hypothetical protein